MTCLKRIDVSIHRKNHPDQIKKGSALITDLTGDMVAFFATEKFKPEEELVLKYKIGDDEVEQMTKMTTTHEQISSGRIMTALPNAEHAHPARTFFRCYARKVTALAVVKTDEDLAALAATVSTENIPETKAA